MHIHTHTHTHTHTGTGEALTGEGMQGVDIPEGILELGGDCHRTDKEKEDCVFGAALEIAGHVCDFGVVDGRSANVIGNG